MEDSKEHYNACIHKKQSQDINPLHGSAGVRVAKKVTVHADIDGTMHYSIKKRQRNISFSREYQSSVVGGSYTTTDARRWSVYTPSVLQAQNIISSPLGTDTTVGLVRCHIMHLPLAEQESTHIAQNRKRYSQTSLRAQHSLYEGSLSSCKEMFQAQASSQATTQESAGCACLPSLTDFF